MSRGSRALNTLTGEKATVARLTTPHSSQVACAYGITNHSGVFGYIGNKHQHLRADNLSSIAACCAMCSRVVLEEAV